MSHPSNSPNTRHSRGPIVRAAAVFVGAGILAVSGCAGSGQSADPAGSARSSDAGRDAGTEAAWTSARAGRELGVAVRALQPSLQELTVLRQEQQPTATYAAACRRLGSDLKTFGDFLGRGRWPERVSEQVAGLDRARAGFADGARECAEADDDETLLAGFRLMDQSPVQTRITELQTDLAAAGT